MPHRRRTPQSSGGQEEFGSAELQREIHWDNLNMQDRREEESAPAQLCCVPGLQYQPEVQQSRFRDGEMELDHCWRDRSRCSPCVFILKAGSAGT